MKYFLQFVISIFASAMLSGCFGPVKTPHMQPYTLSAPNVFKQTQKYDNGKTILIAVPEASPGFDKDDMIYTKKPFSLEKYTKHRWTAAPAEMLSPLLIKTIQNSGCFAGAVAPSYSSSPDLTLNSHLYVLQQEFSGNNLNYSEVRMIMDVTIINATTNEPVAYRSFECVIPAAPNPYGGVVAANKATAEILRQITEFACGVK